MKSKYYPYLFIMPFLAAILICQIFPIVFTFFLSFSKWNGIGRMQYVGFQNYIKLFSDSLFIKSISNTLVISLIAVPITNLLGLVFAYLLNQTVTEKMKNSLQASFFLPYLTSGIAVGFLFSVLFLQKGILNEVLMFLKIIKEPVNWIYLPGNIKPILIFVIVWKYFGHSMVMFIAGLQSISNDIYEAAIIDGANKFKTFFYITIPLLKNISSFILATSMMGCLQIFDEPVMLFSAGIGGIAFTGGAGQEAYTAIMHMYVKTFRDIQFGYGAAVSYGLFVIIIGMSILTNRLVEGRQKA